MSFLSSTIFSQFPMVGTSTGRHIYMSIIPSTERASRRPMRPAGSTQARIAIGIHLGRQ